MDTIDLMECRDQDVIQALSTLICRALRLQEGQSRLDVTPMRAIELHDTLSPPNARLRIPGLLQRIRDLCGIQILVSPSFAPDIATLNLAVENGPMEAALIMGVDWCPTDTDEPTIVDVNMDQRSRITEAIIRGCPESVALFIHARGDVNQASADGRTPIHVAASTQRMDMVVLLAKNEADVLASASDFTSLLSMAISMTDNTIHSTNLLELAMGYMQPLRQCQAPLLVEFLKNRSLPHGQHQSALEKLRAACCDPEFLGQWIESHDNRARLIGLLGEYHCNFGTDYVIGVLSALLSSGALTDDFLRAMRSLLYNHKRLWEAEGLKAIQTAGLAESMMTQLVAQEGILGPNPGATRQQCVIINKQSTEVKLDFRLYGIKMYGSSLCCGDSQQVLAWRQVKGIRIVDQRSGFEKLRIVTNDIPLGTEDSVGHLVASSLLAFGHIKHRDNEILASAEEEKIVIYRWNKCENKGLFSNAPPKTEGGGILAIITGHELDITAIAFSKDSSVLVAGSLDMTATLWSNPFTDGKQVWPLIGTLRGHEHPVVAIAISPDVSLVASGDTDGSIRLWDITSLSCKQKILGQDTWGVSRRAVTSLAISPDGARIAGVFQELQGIQSINVQLWTTPITQDGDRLLVGMTLQGHTDLVTSACFFPSNSNQLLTASRDGTVKCWDIDQRVCFCTFRAHDGPVVQAIFSSRHSSPPTISTYGIDRTVRTWQFTPARNNVDPLVHTDGVKVMQLSPSGQLLASASGQGIFIWDMLTCRILHTLLESEADLSEAQVLTFSTCGHKVAAGAGMRISIWDLLGATSADPTAEGTTPYYTPVYTVWGSNTILALAFSPDNSILASCAYGPLHTLHQLSLWDINAGMKAKASKEGKRDDLHTHIDTPTLLDRRFGKLYDPNWLS